VSAGRPAGRSLRAVLVGIVAGAVLLGGATPVLAAPRNPTDGELTEAQTQQEQAAAEVGRIAALVAAAESELERVGVQAEAAGTAYLAAEEALTAAQAEADRTAAELAAAAEAVAAAEARIATFSRDSYMNGSTLTTTAALLDSAGPGELIQRAALLDYVADNQFDVLGQLEVARVHQANADSAARQARDEMAAAEEQAAAAKAEADAQLAAQQSQFDQVTAQKADLEQQLQAAQIHLLELQGARNAYEQWVAEKAAAEAAARAEAERRAREAAAAAEEAAGRDNAAGGGDGGAPSTSNYVFPTSGYISSCFGWRWGALHGGVDIAAPIGTPIYAATSGIVARSGFANGFGLAIYIRGDDGATTVYGHVNREFVSAGMRVHAGQLIAEVGNRGNSTGPHLHFEVHPSGVLYGGQINPMPWLRARGVDVGGC
jgi:murein DD-endopeptidase MepM/ murein hydrolase activator NlpD